MLGKIAYLGSRNPQTLKILHAGCRPRGNQACQFWWRSVKGFWCGEGSNFGLFHWLASSPLKHSRTAVRVCDVTHIATLHSYWRINLISLAGFNAISYDLWSFGSGLLIWATLHLQGKQKHPGDCVCVCVCVYVLCRKIWPGRSFSHEYSRANDFV